MSAHAPPAALQVLPVATAPQLRAFLSLPWQLYATEPCWVPPLLADVRATLDTRRNPFWEHAERELFLAVREGEVVGRVAAIVDRAYVAARGERVGYFGFYEARNDLGVAAALLGRARDWLAARGMEAMRGLLNPSMNDECGFLLEGHGVAPALMLPYTQACYHRHMEASGMRKAKDLRTFIAHGERGGSARWARLGAWMEQRSGAVFRPLNPRHREREKEIVRNLYNAAWSDNWGFSPWNKREFDHVWANIMNIFVPELSCVAEVGGRPVGVALALPDINPILRRLDGRMGPVGLARFLWLRRRLEGCRFIIAGVERPYRNLGLPVVMARRIVEAALRRGHAWCVFGWTLEDNRDVNHTIEGLGAVPHQTYRLYETAL